MEPPDWQGQSSLSSSPPGQQRCPRPACMHSKSEESARAPPGRGRRIGWLIILSSPIPSKGATYGRGGAHVLPDAAFVCITSCRFLVQGQPGRRQGQRHASAPPHSTKWLPDQQATCLLPHAVLGALTYDNRAIVTFFSMVADVPGRVPSVCPGTNMVLTMNG